MAPIGSVSFKTIEVFLELNIDAIPFYSVAGGLRKYLKGKKGYILEYTATSVTGFYIVLILSLCV